MTASRPRLFDRSLACPRVLEVTIQVKLANATGKCQDSVSRRPLPNFGIRPQICPDHLEISINHSQIPLLMPFSIINLPEEVLIATATHFDTRTLLRLRRVCPSVGAKRRCTLITHVFQVNRLFERISRLRIVWITIYDNSELVLPASDLTKAPEELERRIVFAEQLTDRLSVKHPISRRVWTIERLHGREEYHRLLTLKDGSHLLVLSTTGFICADLETREHWRIPLARAPIFKDQIDAFKMPIQGRDGICIA